MHSEMERRAGTGRWITAAGNSPPSLSITTSAPARTRASTQAKSRTASSSETWITGSAMPRLYRKGYSVMVTGGGQRHLLRVPHHLFRARVRQVEVQPQDSVRRSALPAQGAGEAGQRRVVARQEGRHPSRIPARVGLST